MPDYDPKTGRFSGGLAEIRQHYAGLSKRFDFEVVPPENAVNAVGYQVLGRPDIEGTIEIFRYNVTLYPNSANVYDSLGEALESAGRLEEAAKQYSLAVEKATKNADARLAIFTANRDRLEAKLADSLSE